MKGNIFAHFAVGKAADKRNIHSLKVQVGNGEGANPSSAQHADKDSGSKKQASQDIRVILAGGRIADSDLQYMEVLGSGNAGTVYK